MVNKNLYSFIQQKLIILSFIPALLLGASILILDREYDKIHHSFNSVLHTKEVTEELGRLLKLHLDSETGLRGFSLTADEEFLDPYEGSREKIFESFRTLEALSSEDPRQLENLAQLRNLSREWFSGLSVEELMRLPVKTRLRILREKKHLMDSIRTHVQKMSKVEDESWNNRRKNFLTEFRFAKFTSFGLLFVCMVGVIYLLISIFKQAFVYQSEVTRKLEASNDNLRLAIEARDNFISIASHELYTPLTSLKIRGQLHQKISSQKNLTSFPKDIIDDYVEVTMRQVDRLTRLVNDMMDVSRINSGRLLIQREETELRDLVLEVVERMKPLFDEANRKISVDEIPVGLRLSIDKIRIDQVLTNLLTNALRYGKKSDVSIIAKVTDAEVSISVRDGGIGIPEAVQRSIFNRFERAVSANDVSGLGLGLFICKEIVEAHGGVILVESETGKGSLFTVKLPRFEN